MNSNLFLTCILLSSCVNHEYRQLLGAAKNNFIGVDDIPINQNFLATKNYSFIKVRQGKSAIAIMTLLSINNNEFEWIGSDAVRIKTKFGRVIETYGLQHDSLVLGPAQSMPLDDLHDASILVRLDDPTATFSLDVTYEKDFSEIFLDQEYLAHEVKESFKSNSKAHWSGLNTFWFDSSSDLPIKTNQQTHPFEEPLEIEFYYKY